jgi:nucleotide-binding universal stress UspA family protein
MSTVIVVTNFSTSARNALAYTCSFLNNPNTRLLLLNVYSFPSWVTSDAIAWAAMSETISKDERLLQQEYEWVRENYPQINIATEMVTGVFMEKLQQKATEEGVALIVMGTDGRYNDLLAWDANTINAFVDLPIPVLIIPAHVPFRPVQKIAFAVNYYRKNLQVPVSMLRKLVQFTGARLYVINVVAPQEVITEDAQQYKRQLQESIADLQPVYYEPEFRNIFTAIDNFTAAENIDMLLVIPTRHGIWHNIFQQSHTKGLVYLNHIPVLSLRQEENFL